VQIETRTGLLNFQSILSEADGIIISRGNLGLDVEPEKMALVQKTLIQVGAPSEHNQRAPSGNTRREHHLSTIREHQHTKPSEHQQRAPSEHHQRAPSEHHRTTRAPSEQHTIATSVRMTCGPI
jgi:hypothetical protein